MALNTLILVTFALFAGAVLADKGFVTVYQPLTQDQLTACVTDTQTIAGTTVLGKFEVDTCNYVTYQGTTFVIDASCTVAKNEVNAIPNTGTYFLYKLNAHSGGNCSATATTNVVGVTKEANTCPDVVVAGSSTKVTTRFNCPRQGSSAATISVGVTSLLAVFALLL